MSKSWLSGISLCHFTELPDMEWSPLFLTFKLALVTTILLFLVSIPLAAWLAFRRNKLSPVIETLVSMPLVLPPTVLGFYILLVFSPQQGPGKWLNEVLGIQLVFSFEGLVLASMIYSLPFMVQPIQSGFQSLPLSYREAARVMGKSSFETLRKVLLPSIKPSLLTAIVLSFAHTVGEFGVVLMIGGSIPDETRVASIAIYNEVEQLNYAAANQYSLILIAFSFIFLLSVYIINGRTSMSWIK